MCTKNTASSVDLLRAGLRGLTDGDAVSSAAVSSAAVSSAAVSSAAVPELVTLVRSTLRALAGVDVTRLSDGVVSAQVRELLAAVNALDAITATWIGSFDARDLGDADGCRTTRTWLRAFGRMSQGAASAWLSRGRLLRELPALACAARSGRVSAEQVDIIARLAAKVGTGQITPLETILVDLATAAGPREVAAACERIHRHLDPDGPPPEHDHDRRELAFAQSGTMLHIRGRLDAEAGALLQTALDALTAPPRPDDERTAPQRRADALAELARQSLHHGRLPLVASTRPHLGILITPSTLTGHRCGADHVPREDEPGEDAAAEPQPDRRAGSDDRTTAPPTLDPLTAAGVAQQPELPWLNWIGDVPTALAQRLACDCDVYRIVLDPNHGMPLYLDRTHRLVPAHLRKALYARDRGCRWPGCEAPSAWTDAHHIKPWYLGGTTNIDQLLLLCRYHHHKVHEDGWHITLDAATGELHITRPDGTPYELAPSQPWLAPGKRRTPRNGGATASGTPYRTMDNDSIGGEDDFRRRRGADPPQPPI